MTSSTGKFASDAAKLGEDVQAGAREAQQFASESLESLQSGASEYLEQGRAKAQELAATLEEQIRAQPLTAVLVAAGVGLLIGAIWSRR